MDIFNEAQFRDVFAKVELKLSTLIQEINGTDLKGVPVVISGNVLSAALTSALAKAWVSFIYAVHAENSSEELIEASKKALDGTIREYLKKMGDIGDDQKMAVQESNGANSEGAQDLATEQDEGDPIGFPVAVDPPS